MASLTLIRSLVRESLLLELRNVGNEGPPSSSKYFARPIGDGYVLYYDVSQRGRPQAIPGTIGQHYDVAYADGAKSLSGRDYSLSPEQLAKAEELVSLGLFKKREEPNTYPDIEFRSSRKGNPGSAGLLWKSEKDVPPTSNSYYPKSPQFDFLLVDTEQKLVSLDASYTQNQARRGGSTPTKSSSKSYVMPSGDVAFNRKTLSLQKLFDHLMAIDPRVTADYKIISPDDKFEGKTIGTVAEEPRAADIAVGGTPGKLIVYHGTSTKRWPEIEKKGMLPGKFEEGYADQIKGYSEKNLYFTMDPHTAENYATRAAIWDQAAALILQVEIPDITKIVPDEDSMGWFDLKREYTLKVTPGEKEDYRGQWSMVTHSYPKVAYDRESRTIKGEQHPKNIFQFLKLANQSKAYGKTEAEAPEAGPEYVKDDEYYALLQDIEQKMAGFLTKSLGGETFAYKGWIPPKFVKKWKEYPRKPYPKSVSDRGSASDYETTRQATLKKVKRFNKNESLVRSLVRGMLNESSPPSGFTSSTTHSVGWIDPGGAYHYDPNKRDHGEWAAFQIEKDPNLMSQFEDALKVECGPIPPPPPRTPEEQAIYDAKSDMGKKMDDWKRQGGRKLEGKPIPPYNSMGELYYSDIQSEVRSVAMRTLLRNGWGKVSNAYSMELWKPTRTVVNAWLDLGMNAGSDPERYHNIFDNKKSLVEGDWQAIESFVKRLS